MKKPGQVARNANAPRGKKPYHKKRHPWRDQDLRSDANKTTGPRGALRIGTCIVEAAKPTLRLYIVSLDTLRIGVAYKPRGTQAISIPVRDFDIYWRRA